jgi:thiamine pyrophosphate-dependent acetolactate synthase large subunit-like protein
LTTAERPGWVSDAIALLLRRQGFPYVALVPGSSYRGLHDSLVNLLGDERPQMLVCLHEEHAIAIAHGYAKVTGKPMLAAIHANVGLMHASMAIYNAWCDRVPMVIVGANGPVDAAKRRPWTDWVHTARDQAAMVRPYTKWDDAPASLEAALESLVRAMQLTSTPPYGPAYVVLDADMQEHPLPSEAELPVLTRYAVPRAAVPSAADVQEILALLRNAKSPLISLGRVARTEAAWNARIALAEALNARVISDMKVGSTFPTAHPLHVGVPHGSRLKADAAAAVREADVILSLAAVDLAGMVRQAGNGERIAATIVSASLDRYVHNGASMDHQALPAVDIDLAVGPEQLVDALLVALGNPARQMRAPQPPAPPANAPPGAPLTTEILAAMTEHAFAGDRPTYVRLPRGGGDYHFDEPLGFLGADGGGGVGNGPGFAVGAALALRGSGRLPVAILGDGDYLMGVNALWTAVAAKIPLLVIVANNRGYGNDITHQGHVAEHRGREVSRKTIGTTITGPPPDCAGAARSFGADAAGPVGTVAEFAAALTQARDIVRAGGVFIIDAVTAET